MDYLDGVNALLMYGRIKGAKNLIDSLLEDEVGRTSVKTLLLASRVYLGLYEKEQALNYALEAYDYSITFKEKYDSLEYVIGILIEQGKESLDNMDESIFEDKYDYLNESIKKYNLAKSYLTELTSLIIEDKKTKRRNEVKGNAIYDFETIKSNIAAIELFFSQNSAVKKRIEDF